MFFVIHSSRNKQGVYANEMFRFDNIKDAKSNHFYFLSSAYSNQTLDYFLSEIVDSDGGIITREFYNGEV